MKRCISLFCILGLIAATTSSCYRMPTDEDYSLIPLTNNPDFTKEKATSPTPGVGY